MIFSVCIRHIDILRMENFRAGEDRNNYPFIFCPELIVFSEDKIFSRRKFPQIPAVR